MINRVFQYIEQYHMVESGDRVVVGVSGGADSVCLLAVLMEYQNQVPFTLGVVHVNHHLRGEEALRDAEFVKKMCSSYGIAFQLFEYDVKQRAMEAKISLEEAGRAVRYKAFRSFLKEWNGNKIALAHHENDLAETFLYHLSRGSGIAGLCSLKPVRGDVIRPLLCMKRAEIEHYLRDRNIGFLTDSTNLTLCYTRNKIRHKILPYMEKEINPQTITHIAQTSQMLEDAQEYLMSQAVKLSHKYVINAAGKKILRLELFLEPSVMQNYVIRGALSDLTGGLKDISREHIVKIAELYQKEVGKEVHLPYGLKAVKSYQQIEIIGGCKLEISMGSKVMPMTLQWEKIPYEKQTIPQKKYTKWFDYDKIKNSLEIRGRKPGDYLKVSETGGTKRLKDYFIDCKIPRQERDQVLLLADGAHIMWIVGYRISEYYKVTNQTKNILKVQAKGENVYE